MWDEVGSLYLHGMMVYPYGAAYQNITYVFAHGGNDMGLYMMEFSAQEPTKETMRTIWVTKILHGIPSGVCNFPVVYSAPYGIPYEFL